MLKALEVGHPELMVETFKLHKELLYHPHPSVTQKYFDYFTAKGYEHLKSFYEAIKKNYLIIKPSKFFGTVIDQAFEQKDYQTVIDAYLECLDYTTLNEGHLIKVYES